MKTAVYRGYSRKKASIVIDKKVIDEDALMELALEAGAEDVKS